MFRRLVTAALIGFAPHGAAADTVTSYTLDNGMDVVVIEDHRAPVVVHMVWYKSGSADEPVGSSGVAHFLEHLMFKGTEKFPEGSLSEIVAANGGSDNAFTSYDYTAYYQRVAADRLPLMMEMEADRMNNIRLTEDFVATERQVILEERAQRTDNNPGALAREQMMASQYLNHRYGVPVIGWRHEMEQLDLADALNFYTNYYAPNNAILVVAGDVQPAEVKALAEQYYGVLPREDALPPRFRPEEPQQTAERRLTYVDPRVSQPYLVRSYLAPERDPGDQSDAAALTYLAELLGGSSFTSVLSVKLQFESQIAVFTSAGYSGGSLDDTTFALSVAPAEGVTLSEAEAAMDAALQEFMARPIDADRMEALRTQIKAGQIYGKDDVEGLANQYGALLAQSLTVQDIQDWPEILASVTPEQIKEVAARVLNRDQSVTEWVVADREDAK